MTDDRAAKKAARDRMDRTGERYTVARRAGRGSPRAVIPTEQPFFIALVSYHGIGPAADCASVRDARTGEVTALVPAPPGVSRFRAVTAAAGGLFYLTAEVPASGPPPKPGGKHPIRMTKCLMFRLRVDAGGQIADLTPFPEDLLPPDTHNPVATPDGSLLAYTTVEGGSRVTATVSTSGGQRRNHTAPGTGTMTELSWAADGRVLAYEWRAADSDLSAVHVVETGTAADWVTGSQKVAAYDGELRHAICPLISADGSAVYLTVPQPDPAGGPHWTRVLELPLAGGSPRTLFGLRYHDNPANSLYMWTTACRDQQGRFLLVFCPGYVYRIDIASAVSTKLPFPEGQPYDAAW